MPDLPPSQAKVSIPIFIARSNTTSVIGRRDPSLAAYQASAETAMTRGERTMNKAIKTTIRLVTQRLACYTQKGADESTICGAPPVYMWISAQLMMAAGVRPEEKVRALSALR
jgi:hypothetical protein